MLRNAKESSPQEFWSGGVMFISVCTPRWRAPLADCTARLRAIAITVDRIATIPVSAGWVGRGILGGGGGVQSCYLDDFCADRPPLMPSAVHKENC